MEKYNLMILTSDGYSDLWAACLGQINKYWKEYTGKIIINTESKKANSNICKNELSYLKNKYTKEFPWSGRLYDALLECDCEYVILLLDDFILTEKVDNEEIDKCVNRMENDPNIACFNFIPTNGPVITDDSYDRFELKSKKSDFRINLQAALWRKQYLLKFIRKHENPWQFETWGNLRSRRYSEKIYHLKSDSAKVFTYPNGGIVADGRWRGDEALEVIKKEMLPIDTNNRTIYYPDDRRKTEIVHRTFIEKCFQVFKSLK